VDDNAAHRGEKRLKANCEYRRVRHGRARRGHPRLIGRLKKKDVDARHKAGHDGKSEKPDF
jgi:hypothetical protein